MPRNFVRRIEVMFPIEDEALRDRLHDEILATMCADGAKARRLRADGTYERLPVDPAAGPGPRSQQRFIELARERAQAPVAPGSDARGYLARPGSITRTHAAAGPLPSLLPAVPTTPSAPPPSGERLVS
jgi:hypothetical protein